MVNKYTNLILHLLTPSSVTTSVGQSTVIHADWVIEAACETSSKYNVPENLRYHLLISKFITRINSVMAEDTSSETGCPVDRDICVLLNILEQDFIELDLRIGRNLPGKPEIFMPFMA